jgi:hypothetical protein
MCKEEKGRRDACGKATLPYTMMIRYYVRKVVLAVAIFLGTTRGSVGGKVQLSVGTSYKGVQV